MSQSQGARTFLLVALGAAVAVLVTGGIYLVTSAPGDPSHGAGGDGPETLEPGLGRPSKDRPRADLGEDEPGPDDEDDDIWYPGGAEPIGGGSRSPEGDTFVIDETSLHRCIEAREFEELRRQIDELQAEGKPVPDSVVRELLAILGDPRYGIDAMLALGQVRSAMAGDALADLAIDPNAPEETRILALQALSHSGEAAGLGRVLDLVNAQDSDTKLYRNGVLALAAMGGPQGVGALLDMLAQHPRDDRTDILVTALVKARDADAQLAGFFRDSRLAADPERMNLILRIQSGIGGAAGSEMRREVLAMAQSDAVLDGLDLEPHQREQLRFSAIGVAGAMGGDGLDVVLALVESQTGTLRQCALGALSGARGDEAAKELSEFLQKELDENARRAVVSALGSTGSTVATSRLLRMLDDPAAGVRETAAASLARIGDANAVPEILKRLDGAKDEDPIFAKQLLSALGKAGRNDALPKLRSLLESEDPFWKGVRPWVKDAIGKIER